MRTKPRRRRTSEPIFTNEVSFEPLGPGHSLSNLKLQGNLITEHVIPKYVVQDDGDGDEYALNTHK